MLPPDGGVDWTLMTRLIQAWADAPGAGEQVSCNPGATNCTLARADQGGGGAPLYSATRATAQPLGAGVAQLRACATPGGIPLPLSAG